MFNKILKYKDLPIISLFILIILSGIITFIYALTLRYELKTGAADGLSFAQVIFNFINGRGLVSTLHPPYVEQSWLGIHFSPILYVISPIYYLFPYIETLLVFQSFFIALAAIPIFFTANKFLNSQWYSLVIAIFYLTNPFIVNAQIWDFHEIAFAPLTLSLMLWAVVSKNRIWLVIFCAILLTIKEHYGLAIFGTGLLWAWHWRDPKFGLALAIFGLISFIVVIKILMPYFNPFGVATMMNTETGLGFFGWLASPFADIGFLVRKIIDAIFYSILLIAALWFQPIFSFMWLFPSLADMAVNTLSTQNLQRQPYSYHSAAIIPILLIAYTRTISARYTSTTNLKTWEMLTVTALMSVGFSYGFIALPPLPNNLFELSAPHLSLSDEDKSARDDIIKIIGETSSITAQVNILPQIPVRRSMYNFPDKVTDIDYILLSPKIIFKNRPSFFDKDYFGAIDKIMNDKNWGIAYYKNNWLLFKRGGENNQALQDSAKKDLHELQIKVEELNTRLKPTQPYHQH